MVYIGAALRGRHIPELSFCVLCTFELIIITGATKHKIDIYLATLSSFVRVNNSVPVRTAPTYVSVLFTAGVRRTCGSTEYVHLRKIPWCWWYEVYETVICNRLGYVETTGMFLPGTFPMCTGGAPHCFPLAYKFYSLSACTRPVPAPRMPTHEPIRTHPTTYQRLGTTMSVTRVDAYAGVSEQSHLLKG